MQRHESYEYPLDVVLRNLNVEFGQSTVNGSGTWNWCSYRYDLAVGLAALGADLACWVSLERRLA